MTNSNTNSNQQQRQQYVIKSGQNLQVAADVPVHLPTPTPTLTPTPAQAPAAAVAIFGKYILLVCSVLTFSIGIGVPVSLSVMFVDWQENFGVSRAKTASVTSTCIGLVFGFSVVPGYTMNRYGARFTLLLGSVLASSGMALSVLAPTIDFLLATTGVMGGVGFCFIQLPVLPCLTEVFPRYKTMVISLCTCTVGICNLLSPPLIRYIIDQYSWRFVFVIFAGLALNSCVTGMIITATKQPTRPETKIVDDEHDEEDDDVIGRDGETQTKDKVLQAGYDLQENTHPPLVAGGRDRFEEKILYPPLIKNVNTVDEINDECYGHQTKKMTGAYTYHKNPGSLGSCVDEDKNNVSSLPTTPLQSTHMEHKQSCDCEKDHTFSFSRWSAWKRLKRSKWRFLTDLLCQLVFLQIATNLAPVFSFSTMMMDFTHTAGYGQTTGTSLMMILFGASMFGRLAVAAVDVIPGFHSVAMFVIVSLPGAVGLVLLGFVSGSGLIMACVGLMGFSLGGQVTIHPRCVLDMQSVTPDTFSIALGMASSIEGVVDLILPIVIGWSVDVTGSYFLVLMLTGAVGVASSLALSFGLFNSTRRLSD